MREKLSAGHLPMKYKILMIVGLFILICLALVGLSFLQADTMNGVRSYVRGEGLWAKGQKDAVYYLQAYAHSREQQDFMKYLDALRVPQGDHQARVMLQSGNPQYSKVYAQFLIGQNHPDDIDGMIQFFLRFEHFPYMRDAIAIWTEGDRLIAKLQQLGDELYQAREAGEMETVAALLKSLDELNGQLVVLENDFSLVLGEGARWIKSTLMGVSLALLITMIIAALLVTRQIVRGIEKTEKELKISENRFRSLYQYDMLGILDWHGDGRVLDANEAFLKMVGYQPQDIAEGRLNWRNLTPEDNVARDQAALSEIAANGYCRPFEKEFFHRDGHRVPIYLGAALLDGEEERGICFAVDHSERKRAETELRLAATVFNASSNGIMITDEKMRIIALNRAFCQMSGYRQEEMLGKKPGALRSGLMPATLYQQLEAGLNENGYWQGDMLDRAKDGGILPVHLSISTVHDAAGELCNYVAIFTDIRERKESEEKLRKMAHHDFLTGLANRSLFHDRLNQTIQRAKRNAFKFALLFVDLDRFKPVNDEFGHEIGDKLLQEVASRLQGIVRENDTVARLGGDEFVILLEELTSRQVVADIAAEVIAGINQPCQIDGHQIEVGGSVGITIYPDDSGDREGILRCADYAMYAAKADGRNRFCFYEPSPERGGEKVPGSHYNG